MLVSVFFSPGYCCIRLIPIAQRDERAKLRSHTRLGLVEMNLSAVYSISFIPPVPCNITLNWNLGDRDSFVSWVWHNKGVGNATLRHTSAINAPSNPNFVQLSTLCFTTFQRHPADQMFSCYFVHSFARKVCLREIARKKV